MNQSISANIYCDVLDDSFFLQIVQKSILKIKVLAQESILKLKVIKEICYSKMFGVEPFKSNYKSRNSVF